MPITAVGWPSYYIEDHTSPPQAVQANITSLVLEGVFDRFPDLKLISVENGFGWVPPLMWRLDAAWKLLRSEVPNLERLPSEVISEHVYVTTQPVEEPPRPQDFLSLLEHFGDMVDHILLASDYPHWDGDNPDLVLFNTVPGDVVVHHAGTIHGAGANRSATMRRRAVSVRYCGDGVRYRIRPGAPTKPHHSSELDGTEVVDHPACPLVWSRP